MILKEIKEILGLSQDYKLSRLINALALQISGLISYNELSAMTGFKYVELMQYLNILEKTFITLTSRPFFTNKSEFKSFSQLPEFSNKFVVINFIITIYLFLIDFNSQGFQQ